MSLPVSSSQREAPKTEVSTCLTEHAVDIHRIQADLQRLCESNDVRYLIPFSLECFSEEVESQWK